MQSESYIYAKGEMADRVRSFDWSNSPLGPISAWPVNLLMTVNMVLDTQFPMFIWWGEEKIQFYNDAYRVILGTAQNSKHPHALGQKGEECWAEVWPVISPLIEGVLLSGEAVFQEDQLIPIYRNNKLDDVYWTFSYNPIRGEFGKSDGILVVCTETTKINQRLQENEQQLKRVMDHMAEGVGITDITGQIIYSNPMAHHILRTDANLFVERKSTSPEWFNTRLDGSPLADDEHPTIVAITTGKPVYDFEFCIQRPGDETMYLTMNAAPVTNSEGKITGAVGMFTDFTERKLIERSLEAEKDRSDEQRRLYEVITAATPDLIYVFDLNYRFTYANRALLDMWGKTWETAIGKGLRENGYEDWHAQMHEREIDHIVATKEPVRGEVSFPHATLGKRIYDYILNPVLDDDGRVILVAGTTRDITEIRRAEAVISESEERFRLMAESSGILVAITDESSEATYFSKAWSDLTGRAGDDLVQYNWLDVLHPEDRQRYRDIYLSAFEQKVAFTCEFRVLSKEGEYQWLLGSSQPRFLRDGTFAGYITGSLDITEQKPNEQRKNDFISMVSHELKTPLTSLKGYLQILGSKAQKINDKFTMDMGEKAGRQVSKMTTLINGFLNVARLESGQIHLVTTRFDIAGLFKEVEEEVMTQHQTHRLIFNTIEDVRVVADRDKIGQVINNLISNAVKYSAADTAVTVSSSVTAGKLLISVQDEGIGIEEKNLPRLFERFYRVDNGVFQSVAGFGIGLYLSYEVVRLHGGKFSVTSQLGKGSNFSFELSLAS